MVNCGPSLGRRTVNGIHALDFLLDLMHSVGHLLAVGDGENKLRLISSYNGRTVHNYSCRSPDAGPARITSLGWGVNFTDSKSAYRHLQESDGALSAEDLLAPDTHPQKAVVLLKADLPRELALLDIESSLPKLSTLPATGGE